MSLRAAMSSIIHLMQRTDCVGIDCEHIVFSADQTLTAPENPAPCGCPARVISRHARCAPKLRSDSTDHNTNLNACSDSTCADFEICSAESNVLISSRSARENIPLADFRKSVFVDGIPPLTSEGRFADVTRREAGMRWTWRCCPTNSADADGEVVWSWRPGHLAPSWRMLQAGRRRWWQTEWFTKESAYKS